MKRWVRWVLIVAGVILLIVLLQTFVFHARPIPVEVARVERGDVEDAVSNSQAGTLLADHRSRLGAEHIGRVVAIPHREGEVVKRGEPLVLLDAGTVADQLDLARREVEVQLASQASAKAALELSQSQYERSDELHRDHLISDGEMDQARASLDQARAALAAADAGVGRARAAVRVAQNDLGHMKIVAPYDGVVSQRLVEVGESVIIGQPVIEIVSLANLYVNAAIDEVDIGRLKVGLPARVTLDPYRGIEWDGRVRRVFPVVNSEQQQNRTLAVEVSIRLDPAKPTPRPGTSADVVIVLDTRHGVLRVPTFAVLEGKRVLVLEHGRAVSRDVDAGLRNWEWTEIRSGLREGETVITSVDKEGVRPGARVVARAASEPGAARRTRP